MILIDTEDNKDYQKLYGMKMFINYVKNIMITKLKKMKFLMIILMTD